MSDQHEYDGISYRDEKNSPNVFRVLFTILIVWGVIFMGYYLFSGWSSQSEADKAKMARDERKKAAHSTSESSAGAPAGSGHRIEAYLAAGKQLYAANCAACHGENGKGSVGPDLTRSSYKFGKSRTEITKTITGGRAGGMPAFSGQLDPEQIEGLVEYLLSLK